MENSTNKIIVQGYVFNDSKNYYAALIYPFVFIKNILKVLYNYLLKIIWSELIENQSIDDTPLNLIIHLLFFSSCLLLFYVKPYRDYILVISLILWIIDYNLARQQFFNQQNRSALKLEKKEDDQFIYSWESANNNLPKIVFDSSRVKQISVTERRILGGAFQEVVGKVWQVRIVLYDTQNFILIMQEEKELIKAMQTAHLLAERFTVPIILNDSQGNGKYAQIPLTAVCDQKHHKTREAGLRPAWVLAFLKPSIYCKKYPERWHIYSKWRLENSGRLLKQIIQDSGFLIFILIMVVIMPEIGSFLNSMITRQESYIVIDWPSLWSTRQTIQLTFFILPMLYQGWHLSREKHIYLDRYALKFSIDNQKIAQIATASIEAILSLENPKPSLLVLGKVKSFLIGPFQSQEDSLAFLAFLETGLEELKQESGGKS